MSGWNRDVTERLCEEFSIQRLEKLLVGNNRTEFVNGVD